MAASRAQGLLGRPERFAAARRTHDEQVHRIEARGSQCGRIRQVRRADPDGALTRAREPGKRRQNERELADACRVSEELAQSRTWPAATGEFLIEAGKAARHGIQIGAERSAAPQDVALQQLVEGAHTVFSYSIGALARLATGF